MWHIGTHRFVFLVGPLAFKVPRIRIKLCFSLLRYAFSFLREKNNEAAKDYFKYSLNCIFNGFMENFREARCYFRTRHKLLTPMYLPFIFVNVYRRERGVGNFSSFGDVELITKIWKSVGDDSMLAMDCSLWVHTFSNPENFSYDGKRVRIIDYGDDRMEDLLRDHGDKVEAALLSFANKSP